MSVERWLPVVGWEGLYEVSDLGRVRSLPRLVNSGRTRTRMASGKYLKCSTAGSRYPRVMLQGPGRQRSTRYVHRLVAEAFLGSGQGMEVCHGDGDPTNNAVSNLRWDTHSNNIKDAVAHGTWNMTRKTHCPRGHILQAPNLRPDPSGERSCLACSRAHHRMESRGESMQEAADFYYATIMHPDEHPPLCRNGHPYVGDNFRVRADGTRRCRVCVRERKTVAAFDSLPKWAAR